MDAAKRISALTDKGAAARPGNSTVKATLFGRCIPWVVLSAWLAIDWVAVLYWQSREWGMLGDVPLLIAFTAGVIALSGWLTAWLILGAAPLGQRLIYFLAGIVGMLTIIHSAGGEWKIGGPWMLEFPKPIVGCAVLFLMLRRQGLRIGVVNGPLSSSDLCRRSLVQFSIVDLIILTTGVALFVGLLIAVEKLNPSPDRGPTATDFAGSGLFILAAALAIVLFLSPMRIWIAISVYAVVLPIANVAAAVVMDHHNSRLLISLTTWGVAILLPIVMGMFRTNGYRLARL